MKLQVAVPSERAHTEPLSFAVWASHNEVLSVGDDRVLIKWSLDDQNVADAKPTKLCTLPEKAFPTCMSLQPSPSTGGRRGAAGFDVVTIGASDGKIYFISRAGRVEKAVEAHQGAILALRWVLDGSSFATGGEDGQVKTWSRAGMHRSTLVQSTNPVYALAWSPDSESILYTDGQMLTVKPRQAGSKHTQWKAHDSSILCVDWSSANNTIVSGSDDRTVKVWDPFGRQLYSHKSAFYQYPILSLAWSPDGSTFAVGSYSTIRLCNNAGWSEAMEKPSNGGTYSLDWSKDGTGFVCGCGDGNVLFTRVTHRTCVWRHLEATTTGDRSIVVHDSINNVNDTLELSSAITKVSIGWSHLVVITTAPSMVIFNAKNWNTPAMFELKDTVVTMIKQTERHFVLVGSSGVVVYSYDGRVLSTLRTQGLQCELLTEQTLSVSTNTVAIRDRKNEQAVFLFEALSGKPLNEGQPIKHQTEISDIALDQCGPQQIRNLAILDRNRDVYLVPARKSQAKAIKITSMASQMCWNDMANVLATVDDGELRVHSYPATGYIDESLLADTRIRPQNDTPQNCSIVAFSGPRATIRRPDGALVVASIDQYLAFLHGYALSNKWDDCQRLCRFVNKRHLWACLAAMSLVERELNTASTAYAALSNAPKVVYLDKIKAIPSPEGRSGELALLCHQQEQAEQIFLQAGLVYRAIKMHIRLCHWEKALDLATKHKTHVDTVVAHRQKYMQEFGMKESNKRFIQYGQGMEIDWEKIKAKVALEEEKEERRRQ